MLSAELDASDVCNDTQMLAFPNCPGHSDVIGFLTN